MPTISVAPSPPLSTDSLAEAERLFNECIKLRPTGGGNYVLQYNLALIRLAKGQIAEAVDMLNKVVEEHPDYADARITRAEANLQLGKANEALRDANALLPAATLHQEVPADIQNRARFIRAAAHYQLHLYSEAKTDLLQLLRIEPHNENAQVMEALCRNTWANPKKRSTA